jgi:hypothetical protein
MANIFVNIPVPAASGAGAPVDVSAMAKTKSFVIGGGFTGTVNVEYSEDAAGVGPWATVATFMQAGNLTIDLAAHWIRASSPAGAGGANLDVGSSDDGSVFALLTADGAAVDISALPLLKTAVSPKGFVGFVEISEDGVSWAQVFSFPNGGAVTRSVVGKFARVKGGADIWIGGANDNGDAIGPEQIRNPMSLPEQWIIEGIGGEGDASGPMVAQVSANFNEVMAIRDGSIVGIRARLTAPLIAGTITAIPTIDGAPVPLVATILAGAQDDGSTALPTVIPYGRGQLIGVQYANSDGIDPQGLTMEAWLEVYEEVPPPPVV